MRDEWRERLALKKWQTIEEWSGVHRGTAFEVAPVS
jgi:hypothetical protein